MATSLQHSADGRTSGVCGASASDILLVDDDPKNLVAIEVALAHLGGRLVKVTSGEDALRLLLEREFALILLDVQLPTIDGFETARILRLHKRCRHVPIIFITAHSQNDADLRRGYQLGAVDYLFKPIIPEVLRAKAQVFVELRERTDQVAQQAAELQRLTRLEAERRLRDERRNWEAEKLQQEMDKQRRVNEELADADRRKDEFIAMLAHELRNPLTAISAGIELFRLAELNDPGLAETATVMRRQTQQLSRMLDDLLDVSRITRGKIQLMPRPLDLAQLVPQAAEASRHLVEERQHQLVLDGDPDESIPIVGDAVRVTQVISNLLSNAARYTDPGGRIELRWRREGKEGWLVVRDNGRGIAPELLPHVFDMFVQERSEGRGLGLGLTLVKQLVELHGGRVIARSEGEGCGSEVEVRLPLAFGLSLSPSSSRPADDSEPVPLRIAVVEDDEDVRSTVCALLEQWGHHVLQANSGPSGVDLLVREKPALALVDLGLPGHDGYELARRVTAALGEARPRLVAVSGYGQQKDRLRSAEAGFDAHLVKPAPLDELKRVVSQLAH